MAFQSASDGDEVMSEINITPLVDVMLVLLVAFIVTAPLLNTAIKVNLPKTVAAEAPQPPQKPATVSVDAGGRVYLDDEAVSLERLEDELRARHASNPELALHLRSDEAVNYGSVAKVMALIERAGITRLSVLTTKVH